MVMVINNWRFLPFKSSVSTACWISPDFKLKYRASSRRYQVFICNLTDWWKTYFKKWCVCVYINIYIYMIQRRVAPTPILWYPPIVEAEVQVVVMILVVLVLRNSNNGSSTTSSTTTSSITSSSTRVVLLLLGDHTIGGGAGWHATREHIYLCMCVKEIYDIYIYSNSKCIYIYTSIYPAVWRPHSFEEKKVSANGGDAKSKRRIMILATHLPRQTRSRARQMVSQWSVNGSTGIGVWCCVILLMSSGCCLISGILNLSVLMSGGSSNPGREQGQDFLRTIWNL